MPYVGQSVADLYGELAQSATKDCAHAMCERGGESVKDIAKANTPVNTGALREAWVRSPASPEGEGWKTDIENPLHYAEFVEYGTGLYGPEHRKYLIKPRDPGGTLRWVGRDGQVHFAKWVLHPGSPGNFMLAIGLNVTEAACETGLMDEDLAKWVQECERTGSH